ncbi:MAG TPA: DUF4832 domain-containing protein [Agriterribacter sp.]|nr:DUF4832 domain-containing protein [Chitinophagaceae bacterium]HRP30406.1 DUF4832 domain-containing protein [Agriterribacter sp.]
MKINISFFLLLVFSGWCPDFCIAQISPGTLVVRPVELNEVLINPGIGFTTFQRFNGDSLNAGIGWTEGRPIDYQLNVPRGVKSIPFPSSSIAYWRVYWKYIEPEKGHYRWDMIDRALSTAEARGQTLMLRIAPYGGEENDVPAWYRKMVGPKTDWKYNNPVNKWMVDAEDPRYVEYFGGMISELGKRYDGHPALESVDLSIVGAWGEGAGTEVLERTVMEKLIDAYTGHFRKTPLIPLLTDEASMRYTKSKAKVGWRVDCIGDIGFFARDQHGWTHMYDYYPQSIIRFGAQNNWKTGPVSLEICYTFMKWKADNFSKEQVQYIFDQTLKWHISSFNAKSSAVPVEWEPLVNEWLKKMGYRFVLRKFSCPATVQRNGRLPYETWWENKGVAPCYRSFPLAIRIRNNQDSMTYITDADIRTWLPGDNLYDNSLFIPEHFRPGYYDVQIAIVDPQSHQPKIQLAITNREADGWYSLGKIKVE